MGFLEDLSARRRFGMKPGLDTIRTVCTALGDPQKQFKAIHVAGTNGKGAICAILDAALRAASLRVGRYTSPHLVRLNERFFLDGAPVDDLILERISEEIENFILHLHLKSPPTFFEALTAVAFKLYADVGVDLAVLECGLGGRLDATNICCPKLCVITKVGLDHCDWLGDTVEKIAAEKAGIIKKGVPVILGRNEPMVRAVVEARAKEVGAPFYYAPELANESEIPDHFSLGGAFNRENAVTALAALRVLSSADTNRFVLPSSVVWPGRFQRFGKFIIDGAHNPPAARALVEAVSTTRRVDDSKISLIAGFCGDKDVDEILSILAPLVRNGYAVRTNNPRSLSAEETAVRMCRAGIDAIPCSSLAEALSHASTADLCLICGSLFLAGEALVEFNAYPWPAGRFDLSEALKQTIV